MKPVLDIKLVGLLARSVHRIEGGKGLQITAVAGAVWVTHEGGLRDVILA
jgi:hypothetical protein